MHCDLCYERADTTVKSEHITEQLDNPLNVLPLPMSCSDLVMEQSADPTLRFI